MCTDQTQNCLRVLKEYTQTCENNFGREFPPTRSWRMPGKRKVHKYLFIHTRIFQPQTSRRLSYKGGIKIFTIIYLLRVWVIGYWEIVSISCEVD